MTNTLSPDVTAILTDPDVGGGQSFIVMRTRKKRSMTSCSTAEENQYKCIGNVQPAQAVDLQQMNEEDRQEQVIVIRSTFGFSLGSDGTGEYTAPDEVIYNGERYKVNRVDNWIQWGFTTAWAVRRKDV